MTTPAQHARVWRKAEENLSLLIGDEDYETAHRAVWHLALTLAEQYEALTQELEKEA